MAAGWQQSTLTALFDGEAAAERAATGLLAQEGDTLCRDLIGDEDFHGSKMRPSEEVRERLGKEKLRVMFFGKKAACLASIWCPVAWRVLRPEDF